MRNRNVLPFDIPRAWSPNAPSNGEAPLPIYRSVDEVARRLKPEAPVECVFPQAIRDQASKFLSLFAGQVLYAVKCNPSAHMLRHMYDAGIRHFDVASLEEVRVV